MPHVAGVRHRMVDVGGLKLHVAEAGKGEPVVMLHGWPQHWYVWRHVIPELAKHYHVFCPDLRGFGWSEAPPSGYDKEQLATDMLKLLDELNIGPVRLVGHDWGGFVGFLMCLREPDRFERYLALNIITPWVSRGPTLRNIHRSWYQAVMASGVGGWVFRLRPPFLNALLRSAAVDPGAWSGADMDSFLGRLHQPERANASTQIYRSLLTREGAAWMAGKYADRRLEVPTLMLFGEQDLAISPSMIMGFEEHTDDMRLELVPGCGHFIADERPDLVIEAALRFFA
ncbi:MAG TPA: alpha/beta hydrolase [Candidatus Dormibacteraeota bacterium]|nr:alpha/beta hydrolase [Candidatus Dormibacteraeota bacterium]